MKIPKNPFLLPPPPSFFSFCFYLENGSEASPENVSINFKIYGYIYPYIYIWIYTFSGAATLPVSFCLSFQRKPGPRL